MTISKLDKIIEERAVRRCRKLEKETFEYIATNPFLRNLQVSVDGVLRNVFAINGVSNELYYRGMSDSNLKATSLTNVATLRKNIKEKFAEEESEHLIDRLDSIKYLFEEDK